MVYQKSYTTKRCIIWDIFFTKLIKLKDHLEMLFN